MPTGRMLYHARAAGDHYPSQGSRRGRFEHVSAGMPNVPENRRILCSLHWARAAQGPKGQRALGHLFNGRESLGDSWERLCPRALSIRLPPNGNLFSDTLLSEKHSSSLLQGQGAPPAISCRCRSWWPATRPPSCSPAGPPTDPSGQAAGWQVGRVLSLVTSERP